MRSFPHPQPPFQLQLASSISYDNFESGRCPILVSKAPPSPAYVGSGRGGGRLSSLYNEIICDAVPIPNVLLELLGFSAICSSVRLRVTWRSSGRQQHMSSMSSQQPTVTRWKSSSRCGRQVIAAADISSSCSVHIYRLPPLPPTSLCSMT